MYTSWQTRWRYVAGLVWVGVVAYFAFVRGTRVPVLWRADFGFHELGHLLTYVFPDLITAAMGSVTQVGVPLGLGAYFLFLRGDLLGAGVCAGWAGASAQDASVYIADAPYENLPLIGGHHDWAFVLGPDGLDALGAAAGLARAVWTFGLFLLVGAVTACVLGLVRGARESHAPRPAAGLSGLHARERDILPG